jgi:hypothetical protein
MSTDGRLDAKDRTMEIRDRGREIRSHIEMVLHRRTMSDQSALRRVEDLCKHGADALWHAARRRPYLSAVAIGASIALAGASLGVTEFALGVVATYGALEVIKGRESIEQAVGEIVHKRG